MPTPRHVLLNAFWFTAIGPLFGLVACIIILETIGKTPFNAIGILIEEPLLTILFTYIFGGPAALLTGIFASFINRRAYRHYVIIAFGALISLPLPLFFGLTTLAGDRPLTFFLYAFSGAFASAGALLTLMHLPFQTQSRNGYSVADTGEAR